MPGVAIGTVVGVGSGLSYTAFALWSKDLTDDHDPDLVMTWVFALSAAALLPVGLAAGIEPLVSGRGAAMVLWLGVGSLAASYLLFGRGIAGVAVAGLVLVFAGLAVLALRPRASRSIPPPDL